MYDRIVNLLPLAGEPGVEAKFREEYYNSHEAAAESESIVDPSMTDPYFMARVWAKFARLPRI